MESWGVGKEGEGVWSFWDPGFVNALSRVEKVQEVMMLGCVLAIKIKDDAGLGGMLLFFEEIRIDRVVRVWIENNHFDWRL